MAHRRSARPAVSLLAVVLFTSLPASLLRGQTLKGTILGTLTDSSHAVVPNAQVAITDVNTNFHRTETSNESGFYVFANLDPGNHRVEVEHPGFRKVVRSDLELTPGVVSEVVDVTAGAPLLQTDRADTGGKIDTRQLDTMPMLHNRNYQNLLMLVPG